MQVNFWTKEIMSSNTSESEMQKRRRDKEINSKSGTENQEGSSGEDEELNQQAKRHRYHCHTEHQIVKWFFKECPHPNINQRMELSHELGLEQLQVKFWFQNKCTQMKVMSTSILDNLNNNIKFNMMIVSYSLINEKAL